MATGLRATLEEAGTLVAQSDARGASRPVLDRVREKDKDSDSRAATAALRSDHWTARMETQGRLIHFART